MRAILCFILFFFGALLPAQGITGFTPSAGPVATVVTVTGWGFTGTSWVAFNGVQATTFLIMSDTQIKVAVPPGAATGPIEVETASTAPISFIVQTPSPRITSFTPASGFVGTNVTITGTGISTATDVRFNGVSAVFVVLGPTSVRATVPLGATTGPISFTNPIGTASTGAFKFIVR